METDISRCVSVNSQRISMLIDGENRSFDAKKVNGEHCLLEILPALLDFTDTIRMAELRVWHGAMFALYKSFCLSGVIGADDYDRLLGLGSKVKNEDYFIFTIATCFRINNFDFVIDPTLNDDQQLMLAQKKLSTLKHRAFVACLSHITAYDENNDHVPLNSVQNIYDILKRDEYIYRLCYKSLQLVFQEFITKICKNMIVEPKKKVDTSEQQQQNPLNSEITDSSAI
jgi:hypothetical protein